MEFEDSRNALFTEPNAYIQKCNFDCDEKTKKVIFQEPYDRLPTFYLDNNFKKGNCNCVPKPKQKEGKPSCNNPFPFDIKNLLPLLSNLTGGSGGLSNLLSNLGSNGGLGNLASLLGALNNSNSQSSQNASANSQNFANPNNNPNTFQNSQNETSPSGEFNLGNIVNTLNGSGIGLNTILDLFKNFTNSKTTIANVKPMKSSDIIIKDYKRID